MRQEYRYTVEQLGLADSNILNEKDRELVGSYRLGIQSFNPDESRLDVVVSDSEGNLLEQYWDSGDYTVRGVTQGSQQINRLEVDPTVFFEGRTILGNEIIVEYKAFNNVYGKGAEFYINNISADRTEIQLRSFSVTPRDIQYYTVRLQNDLNNSSYFSEAYLEGNKVQVPIVNALTEIVDNAIVATFKLYEPLPEELDLKDVCQVLTSLGDSIRFRVRRTTVVVEDPIPELKGPNFSVEIGTSTLTTDYLNYAELLTQKSLDSSKGPYTNFRKAALHTSIDHTDFSDFVHFSSAAERLENARFKFEQIFDLQCRRDSEQKKLPETEKARITEQIEGIIDTFDHYENYLYFEQGPYAWPKKTDELGLVIRPYELEDDPVKYDQWYEDLYLKAEAYDINNKDILIATIPVAIREDIDHNEPYLIFIHMLGQHFDDLWIYARTISDRYKGDNRLDFGISKELVKEALENFGLSLYESNQNLAGLFELCKFDKDENIYDKGLETYVNKFLSARAPYSWSVAEETGSWQQEGNYPLTPTVDQPILSGNYTKEVYKRIYHNIPTLLKTRGTSRGLRVLLNCFGIPNDILRFKTQGGTSPDNRPFFGPEETLQISIGTEKEWKEPCQPEDEIATTGSLQKIRIVPTEQIVEYAVVDGTGSFYTSSVLSRYTEVTASTQNLTDDSPKVEVGFDLNEYVNKFFSGSLVDTEESQVNFTVDDVIGDPRNRLEQYGDPWRNLRDSLIADVKRKIAAGEIEEQFREPAAIIRLARYFDTTFYRMLQDFIPARASIDYGVIVKDNILHRNRWKGADVSWKLIGESGSTSEGAITSSHGGAYPKDYDTGTNETVSTGYAWTLKDIPSGSREINGELTGSVLQVTDGELNPRNPDKKAGQPSNRYGINAWFLDLPDLPLCKSKLVSDFYTNYWEFYAYGYSTGSPYTNLGKVEMEFSNSQSCYVPVDTGSNLGTKTSVFSLSSKFSASTETHWIKNSTKFNFQSTFMGWFPTYGSHSYAFGYPETPGHLIDLSEDEYGEGEKYRWTAVYCSGSKKVLWFEVVMPGDVEHDGYRYYYANDLLVSWKLLEAEEDPTTTKSSAVSVWNMLGVPTIQLSDSGSQYPSRIVPLQKEFYGASDGYGWVGVENSNCNKFDGVVSIGITQKYTGPFFHGDTIIDTQWLKAAGDWPEPKWAVSTDAAKHREDSSNYWTRVE